MKKRLQKLTHFTGQKRTPALSVWGSERGQSMRFPANRPEVKNTLIVGTVCTTSSTETNTNPTGTSTAHKTHRCFISQVVTTGAVTRYDHCWCLQQPLTLSTEHTLWCVFPEPGGVKKRVTPSKRKQKQVLKLISLSVNVEFLVFKFLTFFSSILQ